MSREFIWSLLFSGAVATLMLAILVIRSEPVPTWVLVVYPAVGALLAQAASRTSPTVEEIAHIETGTIAAAAIVILAALINLLLVELLMREFIRGEFFNQGFYHKFAFFVLPTVSALLWWALNRRLALMRAALFEQTPSPLRKEGTASDTLGLGPLSIPGVGLGDPRRAGTRVKPDVDRPDTSMLDRANT